MSGFEPLLFGSAATAATATTAATAATTGLFGAGGAFSLGSTLSTLGAGLGAMGAIGQGRAAQAAAEYNAASVMEEARSKESAQRAEAARRLGTIRSQIGKSGATSEGTPLMVLAESAANAEIDALNTLYTGERQANLYRAQGTNARKQGNFMAGTSLLSSIGKFA